MRRGEPSNRVAGIVLTKWATAVEAAKSDPEGRTPTEILSDWHLDARAAGDVLQAAITLDAREFSQLHTSAQEAHQQFHSRGIQPRASGGLEL